MHLKVQYRLKGFLNLKKDSFSNRSMFLKELSGDDYNYTRLIF